MESGRNSVMIDFQDSLHVLFEKNCPVSPDWNMNFLGIIIPPIFNFNYLGFNMQVQLLSGQKGRANIV